MAEGIADLCGAKSTAAGGCSSLAAGKLTAPALRGNLKEKGVLQNFSLNQRRIKNLGIRFFASMFERIHSHEGSRHSKR